MKLNITVLFVIIFLSQLATAATNFKVSGTNIVFFKTRWEVSFKICHIDKATRRAGTLRVNFELESNGRIWDIGTKQIDSPINKGQCLQYTNLKVPVRLKGLPTQTRFAIYINITEKNGSSWPSARRMQLTKDYITN